jgi:hypothetical protein
MMKGNRLALRHTLEIGQIAWIGLSPEDVQRQIFGHRADENVDSLVRHQPANKDNIVARRWRDRGRKPGGIDTRQNYMSEGFAGVTIAAPAEVTEMQMSVVPAVSGNIRGDIPPTAPQVGYKHTTARKAAEQSGQTAREDMPLMAMHDVSAPQFPEQAARERIGALSSDIPGIAQNAYLEITEGLFTRSIAESHQPRRNVVGHVARQFIGVTLGATDDAIVWVEDRRDQMEDLHNYSPMSPVRAFTTSSST